MLADDNTLTVKMAGIGSVGFTYREFVKMKPSSSSAQSKVNASRATMKKIAAALEAYFVGRGRYPASLRDLVPSYLQQWDLIDPCTGKQYAYYPKGTPPGDYVLTVAFAPSNACTGVAEGLTYTPGGGMREAPWWP